MKEKEAKGVDTLVLSGSSTASELERYFTGIMELSGSCEEFPVDLDAIWRIGYRRKDIAVRALRNEFVEGEDYIEKVFAKDVENQRFRRNAESVTGGDLKSVRYYLSVSCAEYLIVRKCRAVFEVYRRVFHHVLGAGRDVAGMGRYYSMEEYCRMFGKGRMSFYGLMSAYRDEFVMWGCVWYVSRRLCRMIELRRQAEGAKASIHKRAKEIAAQVGEAELEFKAGCDPPAGAGYQRHVGVNADMRANYHG